MLEIKHVFATQRGPGSAAAVMPLQSEPIRDATQGPSTPPSRSTSISTSPASRVGQPRLLDDAGDNGKKAGRLSLSASVFGRFVFDEHRNDELIVLSADEMLADPLFHMRVRRRIG